MANTKLSEKYKKPPKTLTIEPYLRPQDQPIRSHPEAREPQIVPLVVMDYGSLMARVKQMRYIGRYMFGSIREMHTSAKSITKNPTTGKKRISADTLQELEAYARGLGISEIGYTRVNPRYIFQGYRILYENAMVFTIEMDKAKIKQAPAIPSFIEIFRTYYEIGVIVNKVAEFLRERGFNAHAGAAIGGDVNYIPLAIDAGLGYSGKNGLLITKSNGSRIRLAAVYTDIENLPIAQENPYTWVRDYCQDCNLCIQKCPADAIFMETKVHADGGPVFIDFTRCAMPFSNDNGCTLCIKHCPFSYGDYDSLKGKFEAALKQAVG
ncbi:MAG TPA: 4Fe-4S dicluster domain-containing protein [Anaerolineales bacterium]|nr:4Fe-4S dicluster domain-containing protein [Anaerolineales bacterium]